MTPKPRPLTEQEQQLADLDPSNPPIVDFSHFTMTAEQYWRKKLQKWMKNPPEKN